MISVVVATDGIWDNWVYDEVTRFVLDESCIQATLMYPPDQWGSELPRGPHCLEAGVVSPSPSSTLRGVQRVAMSFIKRNGVYAKKNFGGDADNATAVVLYLALQEAANPCPPTQNP
jgi:serine/threonine protein phosphatase PrpC